MLREPIEQLLHSPLEFTKDIKFPDPSELRIYDSTLRDGEQMPGIAYTPEQKLEITKALSDIGVHIIDVGFPGVSASEQQALRLIMEAKRRGELRSDLEIVVMCRSHKGDIDATLKVLDEINISAEEVTFFIFTTASNLHNKYKIGKTLLHREGISETEHEDLSIEWYKEANLKMMEDAIRYARSKGVTHIEFGGEDGSRADVDYIIELHRRGLAAGGTRPSFPDTVGVLTPEATAKYVEELVQAVPEAPLLVHFHNDFGFGTINTITAIKCGAKAFCTTVAGYGERAGNAPLHEVLVSLKLLYGIEIPGFKYEKLQELYRLVEKYACMPIQAHAPIIGPHVFMHESGIHTAGVLIDRRIYEAIPSELVGQKTSFVYGKHSGGQIIEHGLLLMEKELTESGVTITEELVKQVTAEMKRLREDKSKTDLLQKLIHIYHKTLDSIGLTDKDLFRVACQINEKIKNQELPR
jgi:isopropylmalate/homocitrate/citramalate synthase